MTPGFAKSRAELPWLYYPENDRVIINAHNFTPPAIGIGGETLWLLPATGLVDQSSTVGDSSYFGGMGVSGGKYTFDATNDYMTTPDPAGEFTSAAGFTASFWLKAASPPAITSAAIGRGYAALEQRPWWFVNVTQTTGLFSLQTRNSAGTTRIANSPSSVCDNVERHLLCVYDPAAAELRNYINGSLVSTATTVPAADYGTTVNTLIIGTFQTRYWGKTMDDIRLYDRVLTGAEITALYNSGVPGYGA